MTTATATTANTSGHVSPRLGSNRATASPRVATALVVLAFAVTGCPKPPEPPPQPPRQPQVTSGPEWEKKLDEKKLLALDPSSTISIKRDVHSIDIAADAKAFTAAFHQTMTDASKHFGLIHVMRKATDIGKPFSLGQRFQGRYAIEDALKLTGPFWEHILRGIEDQFTSDYGVIAVLNLTPPAGEDAVMTYKYLEGSPIAGSSTFVVHPLEAGKCRLTQIFEYQEQQASFVQFFSTDGLKLHDQVVYSQAKQSADLIGAKIIGSDIPAVYAQP